MENKVSDCCGFEMIPPASEEEIEASGGMWRAYACYICKMCSKACEPVDKMDVEKELEETLETSGDEYKGMTVETFNSLLIELATAERVGIRRKMVLLRKFVNAIDKS